MGSRKNETAMRRSTLLLHRHTPSAPQSGPSPAGHGKALLLAGFGLRGEWEQLRGSRAGNERNGSEGRGVAGGELCVSLHDYGHLKLAAGQQNINIASSSQWTSVSSLDWKFKALRESADVWRGHPCFPPQCHQKRGTLCHSPKSLPL